MFSDKAIYIYLIMNHRIGTFLANTFVRLFYATILKQTAKNGSLYVVDLFRKVKILKLLLLHFINNAPDL